MLRADALKILSLEGQPSPEDIKKQYKKLALQTHPDKTVYPSDNAQERATLLAERTEKFKQIVAAYQCLSGATAKEANDALWDILRNLLQNGFSLRPDDVGVEMQIFGENDKIDSMTSIAANDKLNPAVVEGYSSIVHKTLEKHLLKKLPRIRAVEVQFGGFQPNSDVYLSLFLQNTSIEKVTFGPALFNEVQQQQLNQHLANNKKNNAPRKKAALYGKLQWAAGVVALTALSAYFTTLPIGLMVGLWSVSAVLLGHLGFHEFSRKYYSDEHLNKSTPEQIQALREGFEVKTYKDYFSSYISRASWRHPVAFAIGRYNQKNPEFVEKMKNEVPKKPSLKS